MRASANTTLGAPAGRAMPICCARWRRRWSARPPTEVLQWLPRSRQHTGRSTMKVVTLKNIPNVPVEGAEPIEGWTGPVSRSRQTIIEPGQSDNYNCSVVNFSQGCTTGWHTHTCDQVLVVT